MGRKRKRAAIDDDDERQDRTIAPIPAVVPTMESSSMEEDCFRSDSYDDYSERIQSDEIIREEPSMRHDEGGTTSTLVPLRRTFRWTEAAHPSLKDSDRHRQFRFLLDGMSPDQICWNPFADVLHDQLPSDAVPVSTFQGTITYIKISEPYMPARVLRQFGYVQTIPHTIIRSSKSERPAQVKKYKAVYPRLEHVWEDYTTSSLSVDRLGPPAIPPWRCADDYLAWYQDISHLRVQNPTRLREDEKIPTQAPMTTYTGIDVIHSILSPIMNSGLGGFSPTQVLYSISRVIQLCRSLRPDLGRITLDSSIP